MVCKRELQSAQDSVTTLNDGKALSFIFPKSYIFILSYTGEWYKENGHFHGLQKNKCLVRKSNALEPKGSFIIRVCKEYQNCLQRVNIPRSQSTQ